MGNSLIKPYISLSIAVLLLKIVWAPKGCLGELLDNTWGDSQRPSTIKDWSSVGPYQIAPPLIINTNTNYYHAEFFKAVEEKCKENLYIARSRSNGNSCERERMKAKILFSKILMQ